MILCKNCFSNNTKTIQSTSTFTLVRCNSCTFYFKNNPEVNYDSLNEKDYLCYNVSRKNEVKELDAVIRKHFKKDIINAIEIGSGTSSLLNELSKLRYNVTGIEPNKAAAQISQNEFPHIKVINSYFNSNLIPNEGVDIILLYDVIEHLEPDNQVFSEISKFMHQNSLLVVKSGNPLSFNARLSLVHWSYICGNQHISFYSSLALKVFCMKNNLELIKYYKFKNAYGGFSLIRLFINILKFMYKISKMKALLKRDFQIKLANDHFIAVIKKKS